MMRGLAFNLVDVIQASSAYAGGSEMWTFGMMTH
jgi:hypothetical protein